MMTLNQINKFLIFLLPVFFGIPDLGIELPFINLRFDDIIVYLLLLLNFKHLKRQFNPKIFYQLLWLLIIYSFISIFWGVLMGNSLSSYYLVKPMGSLPYLIIIPSILNNIENKTSFFYGALFGLCLFLVGILLNYNSNVYLLAEIDRSSTMKSSLAFESLNPNAVAIIGYIFSYILFIGYVTLNKKIFFAMGTLALTVPFITFARAMSLGVIICLFLYFSFQKKKYQLIFSILFLILIIVILKILLHSENILIESALNIDIETGKGFSNRYTLWEQGFQIFAKSPIIGSGLSTEPYLYNKYYYGHVSHNILLHCAIELGIIGLIIYLSAIFTLVMNRYKLFKKTRNKLYLLQFSFLLGIFISDFAGQELFLNKYAFLIFILSTLSYDISFEKHSFL